MYVDVSGEKAYVGTASRAISAAQESVLFIHGAGFDHTVWTLPARYFARHGLNVVAPDLPGHRDNRSSGCGPHIAGRRRWAGPFRCAGSRKCTSLTLTVSR